MQSSTHIVWNSQAVNCLGAAVVPGFNSIDDVLYISSNLQMLEAFITAKALNYFVLIASWLVILLYLLDMYCICVRRKPLMLVA